MSQGFPSMTALLGLLAVAGYQNRDKLAELLGGAGQGTAGMPGRGGQDGGLGGLLGNLGGASTGGGGLGGLLGNLGGASGGGGIGGLLSGGLSELVDTFKQNGHGEVADSWVAQGPNKEVSNTQLEQAIGPDVLATLTQRTGLSRDELLSRLSRELPQAVDRYTPQGRLPAESEFSRS